MSATWLCAAAMLAGWAGLGLAQPRHHLATFGHEGGGARRRGLRLTGGALLVAAFAIAVHARGWEFGPVLWTVLLCLGALLWVLATALDARRAPWLLLPAPAIALLAGLV